MAIYGFEKKKEKEVPDVAAPGLPIGQVMALRQRGMSNDQIIAELERQGYNSSQIFDALNQVSLGGGNVGQGPPNLGNVEQGPPNLGVPSPPNFSQEQPYTGPEQRLEPTPLPQELINKEQIEEIAEAIIDEKWKEFEEDIKIIIDWKEKTETKINQIEQQIKDLTNNLNNLQKSLINKISGYDKNIIDVGTEMKAMEKVFQKEWMINY